MNTTVRDFLTEKLRKAQDQGREMQFADDMTRAGQQIGAAFSPGVQVDNAYWQQQAQANQQPVRNALAQEEARQLDQKRAEDDKLRDPSNPLAVSARRKLKEIGVEIEENASLFDMQQSGIRPFELFDKAKREQYQRELREQDRKDRKEQQEADRKLREQEVQERREDRRAIREERQEEKDLQRLEKQELRNQELDVPGYGLANTKDDAKKLKDAVEMKSSFDRKLDEMITLRKSKGAEAWDREAVERGKQLSKDLLLAYKDLAKLGVLSQADEKILNQIIPPDPLQFNVSQLAGMDPTLSRMEAFKGDVEADFQTKLQTRLQPRQIAVPKRIQVTNGEETLEIDPADLKDAEADGYFPVNASMAGK